jgi:hypothetical protein
MKTALAAILYLSLTANVAAQTTQVQPRPVPAPARQPVTPDLNAVLTSLQQTVVATSGHIGKLRIEKWKADSTQKQQMQQVADSLQKNIVYAIPGLITDVQNSHGSVSKSFKLYHNINVVYEFLNSLAEAAGAFGKKEEYEPLAEDASAIDSIRQNLSTYIEYAANNLEAHPQQTATSSQPGQGPKKIVIDDNAPPPKKTTKKKKAATPPPQQ